MKNGGNARSPLCYTNVTVVLLSIIRGQKVAQPPTRVLRVKKVLVVKNGLG